MVQERFERHGFRGFDSGSLDSVVQDQCVGNGAHPKGMIMRLSEILNQAEEGFNLMRSRERHEVELTFSTTDDSNGFVEWCAMNNIATLDNLGTPVVTVYVEG
jgi:hypothetical protein